MTAETKLGLVPELREGDRKRMLKTDDVLPTSGSLEVNVVKR